MDTVIGHRTEERYPRWLPAFLAAVILRIVLLAYWEGAATDGIGRTIEAEYWLRGDRPLFGRYTWPELNYIIPAIGIVASGELYWGPRIAFVVLSVAIVPLLYWVSERAAGSRAAHTAAWCAALLPYVAVFSTSGARSETGAAVGTLVAILGILRWDYGQGRIADILLAAAGVAFAQGMRFDAVLVGAGLGLLLLLDVIAREGARSYRIAGMCLFGTLCLVYPVSLAIQWNALYDDPLYFLHTAQINSRQFLIEGGHSRWPDWLWGAYALVFVPLGIGYILSPVILALGVVGVWRIGIRWRSGILLLPLLIQTAAIARNLLGHTQQPQIRYVFPLALAVIPFVGTGMEWAEARLTRGGRRLSPGWRRAPLAAMLLSVLLVEGITGLATVDDLGVVSRQLRGSGLVQLDQFVTRSAAAAVGRLGAPGDSLLVMPFVDSPYAVLARQLRSHPAGVTFLPIYRADDSNLVYSLEEYLDVLDRKLGTVRFVLVNSAPTTQGFRGGALGRDPLGAAVGADGLVRWRDHRFRVVTRYARLVLLERIVNAASAAGHATAPAKGGRTSYASPVRSHTHDVLSISAAARAATTASIEFQA